MEVNFLISQNEHRAAIIMLNAGEDIGPRLPAFAHMRMTFEMTGAYVVGDQGAGSTSTSVENNLWTIDFKGTTDFQDIEKGEPIVSVNLEVVDSGSISLLSVDAVSGLSDITLMDLPGNFEITQPTAENSFSPFRIGDNENNNLSNPENSLDNGLFFGGGGNDQIDGNEGQDKSIYSGNQNNYTLMVGQNSTIITDSRVDGDGTDILTNIELLDFAGETFDLRMFGGTTGLSAGEFQSFIELYIAYFNRAPDAVGLNYWGTAYANGATLEEIAGSFLNQRETLELYPEGSSNGVFLENVYNNVLGRQSDPDGFQFWLDNLDSGALQRDTFILNLLGGAQGSDVDFLDTKVDIGTYFAVTKGLSDGSNAAEVMAIFDGTEASIQQAIAKTDQFYQEAIDPENGEFLLQVVGVLDDPFA